MNIREALLFEKFAPLAINAESELKSVCLWSLRDLVVLVQRRWPLSRPPVIRRWLLLFSVLRCELNDNRKLIHSFSRWLGACLGHAGLGGVTVQKGVKAFLMHHLNVN